MSLRSPPDVRVPAGHVPWTPPFTLGHENAGWVQELGEGVDELEVSQPVAVVGAWGCGRCSRCRAGLETYCDRPDLAPVPGGGGGLGLDGGMAEFLLVPAARPLVPLPDGLDPVRAAPLTDAGLTPYHAVRRSREKLTPGAVALGIDVGGLGHLGIQVLRATTGGMLGDLTIVGLGGGTLPVSFFGIPYEVSAQTTYWGNRAELVEVLDLAARGLLHAEITRFELDQAERAYGLLRSGAVDGRVVVVPNGT